MGAATGELFEVKKQCPAPKGGRGRGTVDLLVGDVLLKTDRKDLYQRQACGTLLKINKKKARALQLAEYVPPAY